MKPVPICQRESFPLFLAERTYGYLWCLLAHQSPCWPPAPSVSQVPVIYVKVRAASWPCPLCEPHDLSTHLPVTSSRLPCSILSLGVCLHYLSLAMLSPALLSLSQTTLGMTNLFLFLSALDSSGWLWYFLPLVHNKEPPPNSGVVMSAICLSHLLSYIWGWKLGGTQMDPLSWARSLPTKSTWFDSPKVICFCWLLPPTMFDSGFQSPPAFFPPPFRTTYPLCKCSFSCPEPATPSWVPTTWKGNKLFLLGSGVCYMLLHCDAGHLCAKVLSPLSVGTLLNSCSGCSHWAFPTAVRSAFEGCLLACLLCQLSPGACSISPACLMDPELTMGSY